MLQSFGGWCYASSRMWILKVHPYVVVISRRKSTHVCFLLIFIFYILSWSKHQSYRSYKSLLIMLLCSAGRMLSSLILRQSMENHENAEMQWIWNVFCSILNAEMYSPAFSMLELVAFVRVTIVSLEIAGINILQRKKLFFTEMIAIQFSKNYTAGWNWMLDIVPISYWSFLMLLPCLKPKQANFLLSIKSISFFIFT